MALMKTSFQPTYLGHVKNGVVHFDPTPTDGNVPCVDGQAVKVEPIISDSAHDRARRLSELQRRFAEWTEEDGQLSDEQADCLQAALEKVGRLTLRQPDID